jgi:hypothetical protein
VSVECRRDPAKESRERLPEEIVTHHDYIENVRSLAGFSVVYIFPEAMLPRTRAHFRALIVDWALHKNDGEHPLRPLVLVTMAPAGAKFGGRELRRFLGHNKHTYRRTRTHLP